MNSKGLLFSVVVLVLSAVSAFAQLPKTTYLFAHRDTCDLFLDIYPTAPDAPTCFEGQEKPTILWVFGGGFIMGSCDSKAHDPWFKILTDNGYKVVSVDYRLGLKGVDMKFDIFHLTASAKHTKLAVDIGVEDVFDAVRFLADNADSLGIDTGNIVIAGSSAGAMISLSCALETCTPTVRTARLPEGFQFRGVMSFAGAVMSDSGLPSYAIAPPPQLLIHGIDDKIVNYNKMAFGRWGMFGTNSLVEKVYAPAGYSYSVYRYIGHTHEMASHMVQTWHLQQRFLEKCVMAGQAVVIDETINDPAMPTWKKFTLNDLYK